MRAVRFLLTAVLLVLFSTFAFGSKEVNIEQVGDNNTAAIKQQGSQNFADVFQIGDWNDANPISTLFCPDCQFNTLGFLQYQLGNDNEARLRIEGNNNHISQWQQGDDNVAEFSVKGDGNNAKQVQLGNRNESFAEIIGDFNVLCHYHEWNGFTNPLISIIGSWQTICVIQR